MNFKEDLIQYIWQYSLFNFSGLTTQDGRLISILSPGILNRNSGPDFENARIKIGDAIMVGSVEIHINGNDWNAHGHQNNLAYNSVILHACYENSVPAKLEDGTNAPCISLKERIDNRLLRTYQKMMGQKSLIPCKRSFNSVNSFVVSSWIQRMGIERLENKCVLINELLAKKTDWNQIAYTVLLRTFGIPLNSLVFEELANAIPYKVVSQYSDNPTKVEALLFGALDLISGNSEYANKLRRNYFILQQKHLLKKVSSQIKTGKMRPQSFPTIRIAQFVSFICSNNLLSKALIDCKEYNSLVALCNFEVSKFWQSHYSFKTKSPISKKGLSQDFIRKLFVNCLAPLQFSYAKHKLLQPYNIDEYEKISPERNYITKSMVSQGFMNNNIFESQALIHLNKEYCLKKRCLSCNIGKDILKQD